jgi:hypothetical protein
MRWSEINVGGALNILLVLEKLLLIDWPYIING